MNHSEINENKIDQPIARAVGMDLAGRVELVHASTWVSLSPLFAIREDRAQHELS